MLLISSSVQKQSINKYFNKEVDRLIYFEKRKELRAKEKREMEAEEQRRKTVSLGAALIFFLMTTT